MLKSFILCRQVQNTSVRSFFSFFARCCCCCCRCCRFCNLISLSIYYLLICWRKDAFKNLFSMYGHNFDIIFISNETAYYGLLTFIWARLSNYYPSHSHTGATRVAICSPGFIYIGIIWIKSCEKIQPQMGHQPAILTNNLFVVVVFRTSSGERITKA